MKKILILLLGCLFLIGCEPNEYPLNKKQIYTFTISKSDWKESTDNNGLNRHYYCERTINGIGSEIYKRGGVMVYWENNGFQQTLPSTRYYENTKGDRWAKTIDYEFSNRNITFYVTNSDFAQDAPEEMKFRVVLIW